MPCNTSSSGIGSCTDQRKRIAKVEMTGQERSICADRGHTKHGKVDKQDSSSDALPEPRDIVSEQHEIQVEPMMMR